MVPQGPAYLPPAGLSDHFSPVTDRLAHHDLVTLALAGFRLGALRTRCCLRRACHPPEVVCVPLGPNRSEEASLLITHLV